jgi:hypothetical protein
MDEFLFQFATEFFIVRHVRIDQLDMEAFTIKATG